MRPTCLVLALTLLATSVEAAPIPLRDLSGLILGGASDLLGLDDFLAESPPAALPLTGSAATGATTASATVDSGSIEVSTAVDGFAAADASGLLEAAFDGLAADTVLSVVLDLDYSGLGAAGALVDVAGDLLLAVSVNGSPVVIDALVLGTDALVTTIVRDFTMPAGGVGGVSVFLGTALFGFGPGSVDAVSARATLSIERADAVVPAPGTLALALAGMGLVGVGRARGMRP
ncbi:MAG: hypothetical protein H6983_02345 [Ectothiorhodospiraceae bacterium]|nr:hypothetical protein [Ectothiorhodospiraceae bacterium]